MTFGQNVKRIRKQQGLSLKVVAEASDVSVSMLSKIERDEKNPTLNVAVRIARALKTALSVLVEEVPKHNKIIIVRKTQRKIRIESSSGVRGEMITSMVPSGKIEMVHLDLSPGASTGFFPPHPKGVKEYLFVLDGALRLYFESREYDLEQGDYVYFEPDNPYQLENLADGLSSLFVVINRND